MLNRSRNLRNCVPFFCEKHPKPHFIPSTPSIIQSDERFNLMSAVDNFRETEEKVPGENVISQMCVNCSIIMECL
jgi:hypothetical protein